MRGRELKDFHGKADFRATQEGVEVVFSDDTGTRLIFALSREEADSFCTQMKTEARRLAPRPLSESKRLGRELRDWRIRMEMKPEDVSKQTGLSRPSVVAVENGFVSPEAQASIRYKQLMRQLEGKRAAGSE